MSAETFSDHLIQKFPYTPTPQQVNMMKSLAEFTFSEDKCFIVSGYAGTGKTSVIGHLIKSLSQVKKNAVLLAPTGRAAKVLSSYSGVQASTIHKKIYSVQKTKAGNVIFVRNVNKHKNTLFIVDEASMISNEMEFGKKSVLGDLMEYVFAGPQCKLIFIGDNAQLPPVGSDQSAALDEKFLENDFDITCRKEILKEVVRQAQLSGILHNATLLRNMQEKEQKGTPTFVTKGFNDIYRMTGEKLEDGLHYAYAKYGIEETVVLCRSNKQANQYNQNIRRRILYKEEELSAGDLLLVVKNNYFWLPETSEAGFLANGDILEVQRVKGDEEKHGFRFATISVRHTDYENAAVFDCKILLDVITVESASLSGEEIQQLFEKVMLEYEDEPDMKKRRELVRKDPYYNALQVKFAYAFTCHKAQGGQWKAVFIDQGYLKEEMIDNQYYRWLYTAFTRASKELFLVNFAPVFFN